MIEVAGYSHFFDMFQLKRVLRYHLVDEITDIIIN